LIRKSNSTEGGEFIILPVEGGREKKRGFVGRRGRIVRSLGGEKSGKTSDLRGEKGERKQVVKKEEKFNSIGGGFMPNKREKALSSGPESPPLHKGERWAPFLLHSSLGGPSSQRNWGEGETAQRRGEVIQVQKNVRPSFRSKGQSVLISALKFVRREKGHVPAKKEPLTLEGGRKEMPPVTRKWKFASSSLGEASIVKGKGGLPGLLARGLTHSKPQKARMQRKGRRTIARGRKE